jgi:hypothetical protein
LDVDGDETSGDGLEFIEIASGETVLAARLEAGWMVELADGSERLVSNADFEANYRVRAGGAS